MLEREERVCRVGQWGRWLWFEITSEGKMWTGVHSEELAELFEDRFLCLLVVQRISGECSSRLFSCGAIRRGGPTDQSEIRIIPTAHRTTLTIPSTPPARWVSPCARSPPPLFTPTLLFPPSSAPAKITSQNLGERPTRTATARPPHPRRLDLPPQQQQLQAAAHRNRLQRNVILHVRVLGAPEAKAERCGPGSRLFG